MKVAECTATSAIPKITEKYTRWHTLLRFI